MYDLVAILERGTYNHREKQLMEGELIVSLLNYLR